VGRHRLAAMILAGAACLLAGRVYLAAQQAVPAAPGGPTAPAADRPGVIASTHWQVPPTPQPAPVQQQPQQTLPQQPVPAVGAAPVQGTPPPQQWPEPSAPPSGVRRVNYEEPMRALPTSIRRGTELPAGPALTGSDFPIVGVQVLGPAGVSSGAAVDLVLVLRNTGSGDAENVRVVQKLPAGAELLSGEPTPEVYGDRLVWPVGGLAAREERRLKLKLRVGRADALALAPSVTFTAPPYRPQAASLAELKLRLDVPPSAPVGQETELRLALSWANQHSQAGPVHVELNLPDAVAVVRTSSGGKVERGAVAAAALGAASAGLRVRWELPGLPAGCNETLTVALQPEAPGLWPCDATASVQEALPARLTSVLRIEKAPALGLDVLVREDPLEVGEETVYELRVMNPGAVPARNVRVAVALPAGVAPVQGEGPAASQVVPGRVAFEPLPALAPRQQALYRVRVRAMAPGDWAFRTELTADQMPQPVRQDVNVRVRNGRGPGR
jgi:uncharacterized repeat protein (TIGR01451 family)